MTSSQNAAGQQFLNQTLAQIVDPTPYVRKDFGNLVNFAGSGLVNLGEFIKNITEEEKKQGDSSGAKSDQPTDSNSGEKPSYLKPDEKPKFEDPGRPDRYTGDAQAGKDVTTGPQRMSDFYQYNYDLIKEQFDRLPGLIDQQNKAELERIAATSAAAKERETIAQWAATERAMIQRDAAMALGLMNTAYLANTPNVPIMQQLNAPLAAVASNYKLPLPGGNK